MQKAGEYITNLSGEMKYKSFKPAPLPIKINPDIDIKKTSEDLSLAFSTVSASIKRLEECGILIQTNNANRNRVFAYEDYLGILRKDT